MGKKISNIVFTKNRPLQLHGYLESLRRFLPAEAIQTLVLKNIACGIRYPVPLHLQGVCKSMGLGKGSFPVAEKCAEQIVSLPMFAELTTQQIKAVCEELQSFVQN